MWSPPNFGGGGETSLPTFTIDGDNHIPALAGLPARAKERYSVSSAFDWERMALHLETLRQDLNTLPWVLLEPGGSRGNFVHDPFGQTIYGSNSRLAVGSIHLVGEAEMAWHPEPVLTFVRILRGCPRAEAQRWAGRKLRLRKYYYEVLID